MLLKKLTISINDIDYDIKDITLQDFFNYIDLVKEVIEKENDIDIDVLIEYISYFFNIKKNILENLDEDIIKIYASYLTDFMNTNIINKVIKFATDDINISNLTKEDEILNELYKDDNDDEEEYKENNDERYLFYDKIQTSIYTIIRYYCLKTKDSFSNLLDKDFLTIINYISYIYKNDDNNNNDEVDELFE